jgi:hypothetical protein
MTPAEALARIQRCFASGRFRYSWHARNESMPERGARPDDVRSAVLRAWRCEAADRGCWKIIGPDTDGDELRVIAAIEEEEWIKVVTVTGG